MSLFDYPRLNFIGEITLNPGTANNDDYAQIPSTTLPEGWGPFSGQALGLIDAIQVEARTFGLSDDGFIDWVQEAQPFDGPKGPVEVVPAEWNYYGTMDSKVSGAKVIGVQTGPGSAFREADTEEPLSELIGADLAFSGGLTDINPEGSPPATQFFIDQLTLTQDGTTLLQGVPSKGTCQWINFFRNVNLTADSGAGGYVYHVIPLPESGDLDPRLRDAFGGDLAGFVFRYYLYRRGANVSTNDGLEQLYQAQEINPTDLQIAGTFAPLRADEKILAAPVGRLLTWDTPNIPTPTPNNNGGGTVALAPAIAQLEGDRLSVDFIGTFPDNFEEHQGPDGPQATNLKFDFGPVTLYAQNGEESAAIATIGYQDTAAGDAKGWLFDFDLQGNESARNILAGGGTLQLASDSYGAVLSEDDYMFVTNQQAVYVEQGGPGDLFRNQGEDLESATIAVFHRGEELTAETCPPITVWQYHPNPIQDPGNVIALDENFEPGQKIEVATDQPGNLLLTFTINDAGSPPPMNYNTFLAPPWVTNAPQMSLRVLPNGEDFSHYYRQPVEPGRDPVGNAELTFDVVFEKVLRTYYLLYPGMNKIFDLSDEKVVAMNAQGILGVTDYKWWATSSFMPRTRDMSTSRRALLRAWCHAVLEVEAKG